MLEIARWSCLHQTEDIRYIYVIMIDQDERYTNIWITETKPPYARGTNRSRARMPTVPPSNNQNRTNVYGPLRRHVPPSQTMWPQQTTNNAGKPLTPAAPP